jgi:hypothetical protein
MDRNREILPAALTGGTWPFGSLDLIRRRSVTS